MVNSDEVVYEVVLALAEAECVPTNELEHSLAEYIDPSLIERLVSSESSCELTFRVRSHEVTVTSTGEIFIDGTRFSDGHLSPPDDERIEFGVQSERVQIQRFFNSLPCTVYKSRNEAGWPIEFISENCRELTGYAPNAFVIGGVTFGFDIIHPDDRERVSAEVQESLRREQPFSIIYRIRTASNEEKLVMEIGTGLFEEEGPISFVGSLVDVTGLGIDPEMTTDILV